LLVGAVSAEAAPRLQSPPGSPTGFIPDKKKMRSSNIVEALQAEVRNDAIEDALGGDTRSFFGGHGGRLPSGGRFCAPSCPAGRRESARRGRRPIARPRGLR